jgi:hypothetical protein
MPEITELFPKGFLQRQGTNLETCLDSLHRAATLLETNLSCVPDEAFNASVQPGKWSPAEIADHVVKANDLFVKALEIGLQRTRNPGLGVLHMPRGQVTADGRAVAPTEEEPTPGRARMELNADLKASVARLEAAARDLDRADGLGVDCVNQSFFGLMTGLECLQLMAWHTAHHAKQLPV